LPVAARAQSSPRDRINVLLWTNACQPSIIVSTTTNVGAGMSGTQFRLFLMMVLQLAIWGSWALQIFGYVGGLGFTPFQQSMILNAFPVGAILAMFFTTQFADRHFAAEKTLAFSHLIGGAAMIGLYYVHDFWPFLILMYVHCLFYVPTFSITNSIAFAHLKDAKEEFGAVRMGGTIGWILVAWPFLLILVDYSKVPAMGDVGFVKWLGAALGTPLEGAAYIKGASSMFLVAGGISFVLAAFSLTLPHTPPKKGESLAWLEAMKLLAVPFVLILWIVTLIDSTVHQSFFAWTFGFLQNIGIPSNWAQPIMSIGQIAEILTMLVLGVVLKNFGYKTTMIVGVLGHVARFLVFAYFPENKLFVVAVNVLHGICYAFFFAAVYIFVEQVFPKDARSSAQGLFNLMIFGIGPLIAFFVCPMLMDYYTTTQTVNGVDKKFVDYRSLFLWPAGGAAAGVIILALFFHPPRTLDETTPHGDDVEPATA
jgi:predicted MFS family arabinose efflux permease